MGRVLTLLYHRVNNLEYDKNLLAVAEDNFYEQLLFLKKNYPIVRFEEDWNPLKEDAVCITFDDGYMDNFTKALPVLHELHIPATVFVSTGVVNTEEEFWWDELERILLDKKRDYQDRFVLNDTVYACQWPTGNYQDREELYDTLHWLMYDKTTVEKRKDWFRQLREWSGHGNTGRCENRGLQTAEADLTCSLLDIGAHTVNHPSLRKLSVQEQSYEIGQSISDLEKFTGRKIKTFSYPFGTKNDYDHVAVEICKREGICKAAANIPGLWTPQCDEYQIPRNIVRNWDRDEYIKRINQFWKFTG